MAINQYTKPTEHRIQKTQVLPRTELLLKALEQRQGQYDATADKLAQAEGTISKYQVVGDYAKAYLKNKEDIIAEAGSNLMKEDLADRSVQGKVHKLIETINNDDELKIHLSAAQSYKAYNDQLTALGKEGKMHDNNVHFMRKAWDTYKKTGQFSDELANPVIAPYVNVTEARGELVKMIKDSGGDSIQFLGDGIAYTNSSKGVSIDRIKQAVNDQLLTYSQSPAGRQELTDWRVLVDKGILDKDKMPFDQYLAQQVFSTAKNYSHMTSSSDKARAMNDSRKEKAEAASAGEGYMSAMTLGKAKVELDDKNRVNIPLYMDVWEYLSGKESRTPAELELENIIHTTAKKHNMSPKAVAAIMNTDTNIKVSYFNTKVSGELSKRFYNPATGGGQISSKMIYSDDYPNGISAQEFIKTHGLTDLEAKGGITIFGELDADNPKTPKGYTALIGGKQIIIDERDNINMQNPSPEEQKRLMDWNANQAKYNGTNESTAILGGMKHTWKWDPVTNIITPVSSVPVKKTK